ncbi:hypothetical protein [Absidia glauca]|uniref:Uncharacterized protein n=1 Tax=Absidia glauca TaxID=4829 RepID=A0A168NIX8_ABSGL|nr:hypothetical protein [Absidia glauca]
MNTGFLGQFKQIYDKMEEQLKWKLSTGRYVEDIIYKHGLKLEKESCLHSFILDTDDDQVHALFDDEEFEEVISKHCKEDPDLPRNVYELLQEFNQNNSNAIHAILKDSTRKYEDYNTRSIFYAVDSLTMLFDATPNPLMSSQLEQWYQANIWTPLMDKMYGDVPGVACVLGESLSIASKERKRLERKRQISKLGSRSDMVLRRIGNGIALEYGAAEDGATYDGAFGRKRMYEAELKLPKTLKDMMMMMCNDCDWDGSMMTKIEVVGYCHSGTVAEFLIMDNPSGYVCRLSRSRLYQVPHSYEEFPKLLHLLAASMRMKLRVKRCIDTMNKPSLDLEATKMFTSKRKKSSCLADTLTTPPRPVKLPTRRKRNPYLSD